MITLYGILASFSGTDAYNFFELGDKYFAVSDLAGAGGLGNRFDHAVHLIFGDSDIEFYLGQEVDHVFSAPIQFRMAFLSAEPFDLGDGDALNANVSQSLSNIVEFERFDNCGDQLH